MRIIPGKSTVDDFEEIDSLLSVKISDSVVKIEDTIRIKSLSGVRMDSRYFMHLRGLAMRDILPMAGDVHYLEDMA